MADTDTKPAIQRRINVVLFDLGGTLIYENGPWEPSLDHAVHHKTAPANLFPCVWNKE